MAITETIATWVMEQFADRAFSSVIDKVKDFALSKLEKMPLKKFAKYFLENIVMSRIMII